MQSGIRAMARLNARHPWSHNDAFHPWLLRNLPPEPHRALDIGCGHGLLLRALAPLVDEVVGIDADPTMRRHAAAVVADLPQVTVSPASLDEVTGPFDVVTMIAVLHHLDPEPALQRVRSLLAPGGRLLVVGLAPVRSGVDLVWDLASMVTNPLIGFVKHPRPVRPTSAIQPDADSGAVLPPMPVRDPGHSVEQLRAVLASTMPGARLRRRLAFRHTITWTKPGGAGVSGGAPRSAAGTA